MILRKLGILYNQGKDKMEGQIRRKDDANIGGRLTHLLFQIFNAKALRADEKSEYGTLIGEGIKLEHEVARRSAISLPKIPA
jgi:hypothetical protein